MPNERTSGARLASETPQHSRAPFAQAWSVDGKEVAKNSMEHTTPITFPEDETFDVGQDTRTGVALLEYRYDPPFKFTGKINKLRFKLEPEPQPEAKR